MEPFTANKWIELKLVNIKMYPIFLSLGIPAVPAAAAAVL